MRGVYFSPLVKHYKRRFDAGFLEKRAKPARFPLESESAQRSCRNGGMECEAMANLTAKELSFLENQLDAEQNLVKKYQMYAAQLTDPQLKTKCEQIASKHQTHFNKLLGQLS